MRAYFLCNMYLSPIQCGIQSAHVVGEMTARYCLGDFITDQSEMFIEWAAEHKTMVLLNGGYQKELEEFYDFLRKAKDNPFPFEMFREEQDALNGAMTSVGIILPEQVYAAIAEVREGTMHEEDSWFVQLDPFQQELAIRLSKLGLAR